MEPSDLAFDLKAYDFELPEASIAQRPIEPRHASRMLVLEPDGQGLSDRQVSDLPELLAPGTLLVVNDTRVVPARLLASKATGGQVELLLVRPFGDGGAGLLGQVALTRSSKPLKAGQTLTIEGQGGGAVARVAEVLPGGQAVLDLGGARDLDDLLQRCGHVPLPPYIRGGKDDPEVDRPRYQCTFAQRPGAVAAPTAGLHLSQDLLDRLDSAGIERIAVTLHVGPGTFLPVRVDDLRQHRVLPERFEVSESAAARLQAARAEGRPIVAVGTTVTRTLETLALRCEDGPLRAMRGDADLTILPGHRFRLVQGMLTNFHLPQSSLLVLVCTFAGRRRVLDAYRHAVAAGYRFYSYGDAMLIRPLAR